MDKNASPKAAKIPQTSPEAPSATFIQLDGKSSVPSQFRTPGTFTITQLQSPAGLPDRITELSPVPALLVSISLKSLPSSSYQVWTADKLLTTSNVHPFRSNVIDFDSQPFVVQQQVAVQGGWRTSQPHKNRVPHISILRCGQSRSDPLRPSSLRIQSCYSGPNVHTNFRTFLAGLQWNAATECNIMLPLAAFPMHYYPAARCNQSCHLIRSGLDYQIQRSAAAWPLRSEQTGVRCGLPVIRQVRAAT